MNLIQSFLHVWPLMFGINVWGSDVHNILHPGLPSHHVWRKSVKPDFFFLTPTNLYLTFYHKTFMFVAMTTAYFGRTWHPYYTGRRQFLYMLTFDFWIMPYLTFTLWSARYKFPLWRTYLLPSLRKISSALKIVHLTLCLDDFWPGLPCQPHILYKLVQCQCNVSS